MDFVNMMKINKIISANVKIILLNKVNVLNVAFSIS